MPTKKKASKKKASKKKATKKKASKRKASKKKATKKKTSPALKAFAKRVRDELLAGGKVQAPGLGTFSTCARKAAPGRPACRMAMFRADPALRAQLDGGSKDQVDEPGVEVILQSLSGADAAEVPGVGSILIDREGAKTRVLFRGAPELDAALRP